jgi:hypothetical protein
MTIYKGQNMNIDYYDKLEEVDKELESIDAWQQAELDKLYAKTKKKIDKALAKLSKHIPLEVKHVSR